MKTYDEPVTFCHRCGLFNDEAKNVKRNYVMDATISTSDPEGGGSARDTRVSLTSVDMVSRIAKCCWMLTFPMVCRGTRQVVTALFKP